MATTKKTVSKKPAPAAAKKTKAAPVLSGTALTGGTVITYKGPREKTGPKTDLLALVPKKGSITVKALAEKADGFKPERLRQLVASLARYGYVELKA